MADEAVAFLFFGGLMMGKLVCFGLDCVGRMNMR
jgi:hypothetical protein